MQLLKVTIGLTEDIQLNNLNYTLSNFINSAMLKNEELKKIHKAKVKFKHYCFSGLTPIEKEKIYKKGCFYEFHIKSPNEEFLSNLKDILNKHSSNNIMCFNVSMNNVDIKNIEQIKSLTPAIITHENKTLIKPDLLFMQDKIRKNTIRKYNDFYNTSIEENFNFITSIEILNLKQIKVNYKNTSFFGNKFSLLINPDETSQKIAKFLIQTGLLEKNSIGLGYCISF